MSLERLSELLFEYSESIPNGAYVNLMNELRDIHRARPVVPVVPQPPPIQRPIIRGVEELLNRQPVWGEWKNAIWEYGIVEEDDERVWTCNVSHYAVWEIFSPTPSRKIIWAVEGVNRQSIKVKETIYELRKAPNNMFIVAKVMENRGKLITLAKIKNTIFNLNTETTIYDRSLRPFTREEIMNQGWNPNQAEDIAQ